MKVIFSNVITVETKEQADALIVALAKGAVNGSLWAAQTLEDNDATVLEEWKNVMWILAYAFWKAAKNPPLAAPIPAAEQLPNLKKLRRRAK